MAQDSDITEKNHPDNQRMDLQQNNVQCDMNCNLVQYLSVNI